MSIGEKAKGSLGLFLDSLKVLFRMPVLLVPIFVSWIVFASIILYVRYYFNFPPSILFSLGYIYLIVFIISLVICLANNVMLEIVQQMESGEAISMGKALKDTLLQNLLKVIPIAAVWALIWSIIIIIRLLTSKKRERSDASPSMRDTARTLGGLESGPFSWLKLGLAMFEKLVRMTVFLILPSIAWENKGPLSSVRRASQILRNHTSQFLGAYTLTGLSAILMMLPVLPVFWMDEAGIVLSSTVWTMVIIYLSIVWTLSIYLEQMSVGMLYLWHMKWERGGGKEDITSVPRPDLLDDFHEFRGF